MKIFYVKFICDVQNYFYVDLNQHDVQLCWINIDSHAIHVYND